MFFIFPCFSFQCLFVFFYKFTAYEKKFHQYLHISRFFVLNETEGGWQMRSAFMAGDSKCQEGEKIAPNSGTSPLKMWSQNAKKSKHLGKPGFAKFRASKWIPWFDTWEGEILCRICGLLQTCKNIDSGFCHFVDKVNGSQMCLCVFRKLVYLHHFVCLIKTSQCKV